METGGLFEEMIERCLVRLARGEELDAVLRSYPSHENELRAILAPAQAMIAASIPPPRPAATSMALNRMLSEVQAAAPKQRSRSFLLGWLGSLKARPLVYQALAGAGALVLAGGVSIGVATATGSTPRPVQRILRISSDSEHIVTLRGRITAVSGDSLTLALASGAPPDARTITITAATKILRDNQPITIADLRVGDDVEVQGAVHAERFEATTIRTNGVPPVAAATAAPARATSVAKLPAFGTPTGKDGNGQGGNNTSHNAGAGGDDGTPHASGSSAATTPAPSNNGRGGDNGGHDGPTSGATSAQGDEHGGTPEGTEKPESSPTAVPTTKPQRTHSAEPTEKPEATEKPEPTEDH